MSSAIGVGIIGYGFAGRDFHRYLIGLEPGLRTRAVLARSPERQALAKDDEPAAAIYGSLEPFLNDERVDLVVIATPHSSHAELCLAALGAGKHVVVDKVMCLTVDEADRLIAARDKSGRMLSVFQNRRWDGDYLTVRSVIDSGALGEVFLMHGAIANFRGPKRWRAQGETEGGILFDWGSHLIDQFLRIDGSGVESVFCRAVQHDDPALPTEAYARLDLQFQSGRLATVERTNTCAADIARFRILGRAGTFEKFGLDPQEKAMLRRDIRSASDPEENWGTLFRKDAGGEIRGEKVPTLPGDWPAYYRNIAAALRGEEALEVTAEQCREQVRILEASVLSAREDRVVKFG